jgi:cytochrome c oxidase subunit 4
VEEREQHEEQGGHVGHIVPVRVLAATGLILLMLTALTVLVASYDFGNVNIWVALTIAAVKASLVVLFFMHLRYDRPFNGVVFVTSLVFVTLFISFTLTDTREYAPEMNTGNAPAVQQKIVETESGLSQE